MFTVHSLCLYKHKTGPNTVKCFKYTRVQSFRVGFHVFERSILWLHLFDQKTQWKKKVLL